MRDSDDGTGGPRRWHQSIWLWLSAALLLIILLTWGIVGVLVWSSGGVRPVKDGQLPTLTALLSAAIPAAALAAAGAAGAVGIRRQLSLEDTYRLDRQRHRLDETRADADALSRLRDRYTTAASQLGDDAVAVRMAGVYSMAALADDWLARAERSEAQVCIDLLCAYIRVPSPASKSEQQGRAEQEVRQTITRVIGAHLQDPSDQASWCGMHFDFTGATFTGKHSFEYAQFAAGSIVLFRGARFESGSDMHFDGATFQGESRTIFSNAKFEQSAISFKGATFDSHSSVRFDLAAFSESRALFDGASIRSEASIGMNLVCLTNSTAVFHDATFEPSSQVSFEYLQCFERSGVTLGRATLEAGSDVTFEAASLWDRSFISFAHAQVDTQVPGPWKGLHPPVTYSGKEPAPDPELRGR